MDSFVDVVDSAFSDPEHFEQRLSFGLEMNDEGRVQDKHLQLAEDVELCEALEDIIDVFCVGASDSKRWRSFLQRPDGSIVHPEQHHDDLMQRREFHANMVYEYTMMLQIVDPTWRSTKSLNMLREGALLELRTAEIHIASFQLVTGVVGVKSASRDDIYTAASIAYSLHLHIYDMMGTIRGLKKGRKDAMDTKPSRTDSKHQLSLNLNTQLYCIYRIMDIGGREIMQHIESPTSVSDIRKKMTLLIRFLDKVLIVM